MHISFSFQVLRILFAHPHRHMFVGLLVYAFIWYDDIEVGYRVEAVKSGVSRTTMIYSVHPGGYLEHHPYFVNQYEEQFKQSLPGLRDMLSQIPEYHILNLIERIIKGSQSIESSNSSTVSGSCDKKSVGPSASPVEEPEEKLEEKAVTSPYISNSVHHASECETTVL